MKKIFNTVTVLLISALFLLGGVSPLWADKGVAEEVVFPVEGNVNIDFPALPSVIISPGKSTAQFEEYRQNGRLYMIKVTPRKGYAYYLIDSSGDGLFDVRRSNLKSQLVVPQWVLKRW